MSEEEKGTAVATTDPQLRDVVRAGEVAVSRRKETNRLYKSLQGMKWGDTEASSLSVNTLHRIADLLRVSGANELMHLDILGGKVYLNANFFKERIATDPFFVRMELTSITEEAEAAVRVIAAERRKAYDELSKANHPSAGDQLVAALDLEATAQEIALARANMSVPKWAKSAYQCTIHRFLPSAPLDKIKSGDIPWDEAKNWIVQVREANWAGGKPSGKKDPVGEEHHEKTARSRAIRRCGAQAFSSWMQKFEAEVTSAEEALEADWEIVVDDQAAKAAALPAAGGPQAIAIGAGEPEAANADGAVPLPVEGEDIPEADVVPDAEVVEDEEEFDVKDARKRLFATLGAVGMGKKKEEDKRKAWQKENGLPASTADWKKADYERVQELIVGPVRASVMERIPKLGIPLSDLALQVIGREDPDYMKHWVALSQALDARLEDDDEEGDRSDQGADL